MVIHGIICENMWPRHLSQKIFSWFGREDGQCLTGNLFGHMTSLHTIISQNERGKHKQNKHYTVSIIGLEPTRPGYTVWFGLVYTVYPGLVGSRPNIDTVY